MGFALYGNELDEEHTPLAGRLGWAVKLDKGDFSGRDALVRQREEGSHHKLVGIRLTERGFPRPGYPIIHDGNVAGSVTSGTVSPSLGYGIVLGYRLPNWSVRIPKSVFASVTRWFRVWSSGCPSIPKGRLDDDSGRFFNRPSGHFLNRSLVCV
jgi:glycine cleavage system aminomethyltransferase T